MKENKHSTWPVCHERPLCVAAKLFAQRRSVKEEREREVDEYRVLSNQTHARKEPANLHGEERLGGMRTCVCFRAAQFQQKKGLE
jgi:hypothetical protein